MLSLQAGEGTLAHKMYGVSEVRERHRHRYEFNNAYREQLDGKGFVLSGLSPDGRLVEIIELEGPSLVPGDAVPSGI